MRGLAVGAAALAVIPPLIAWIIIVAARPVDGGVAAHVGAGFAFAILFLWAFTMHAVGAIAALVLHVPVWRTRDPIGLSLIALVQAASIGLAVTLLALNGWEWTIVAWLVLMSAALSVSLVQIIVLRRAPHGA